MIIFIMYCTSITLLFKTIEEPTSLGNVQNTHTHTYIYSLATRGQHENIFPG